jgi:fatty acid desaturase
MRGFREVLVLYVIPYLWVNHWLVAITFLQHTDPLLPHYSPVADDGERDQETNVGPDDLVLVIGPEDERARLEVCERERR